MKNVFVFISVLAAALIIAWVLFTYVFISDEDRIHRLILKSKQNVESGSILSLANVFAPDYSDKSGADKAVVLQTVRTLSQASESINIQIFGIEIDVKNDKATTILECRIDAESNDFSFLSRLQNRRLDVHLEWIKLDGYWKLRYSDMNSA